MELLVRHGDLSSECEPTRVEDRIILLNFTSLGDSAVAIPRVAQDKFVEIRVKNRTGMKTYGFVAEEYDPKNWLTCESGSDNEPCEQVCDVLNELVLNGVGPRVVMIGVSAGVQKMLATLAVLASHFVRDVLKNTLAKKHPNMVYENTVPIF